MEKYLRLSVLFVFVLVGFGCSNFSKYDKKMDKVKLKVVMQANSETIDLKADATDDSATAVGAAANAASTVQSVKAAKHIQSKFDTIDPNFVKKGIQRGLKKGLSNGKPFKVADKGTDGDLVVKVYSYGMERQGSSPQFMGRYLLRVYYGKDRKRVFKGRVNCDQGPLFEQTDVGVIQSSAFLEAVKSMSNEKFQKQFNNHLDQCGQQIANKLRSAAS